MSQNITEQKITYAKVAFGKIIAIALCSSAQDARDVLLPTGEDEDAIILLVVGKQSPSCVSKHLVDLFNDSIAVPVEVKP